MPGGAATGMFYLLARKYIIHIGQVNARNTPMLLSSPSSAKKSSKITLLKSDMTNL